MDRCLCTGRTFADLVQLAAEDHLALDDLCQRTGAGGRCGLCRPYLREALRTGQVEFHELLPQEGESDIS